MKIFLLAIPLITSVFGFFIYRFQNNKKEIFKLDLVQFVYLFIIAPTMFVWMKSFIFYILRNELELSLSVTDLFVVDTIFSVMSFIVFAAISIHSLTKTFWIKRHHDPEFDLFHLSEYFHLWWTHIIIWGGGMVLGTFLSVVNVLVPLELATATKFQFYLVFGSGFLFGILLFLAIWNSDALQGNFMRLMKLFLALFLLVHIVIYFIFDPKFNISNGMYWFMFATFIASVVAGSTFENNEKTNRLREFFLHVGWGDNKVINVFAKPKVSSKLKNSRY
ncbi:MAG: hypothetical protein H6772_02740 [Pseudomonadales bacterium]|nr:hypothetical protein [Pseudomonadales bacterium]